MSPRIRLQSEHRLGPIVARYLHEPKSGRIGLQLVPVGRQREVVGRRGLITGLEVDAYAAASGLQFHAWSVDSLMQVKVAGDTDPAGFAQGRTLRNSGTVERLALIGQNVAAKEGRIAIRTTLEHPDGWRAHHDLAWTRGTTSLGSSVTVENCSRRPLFIEQLASFSISGITPFARDDAPGQMRLHRIRSAWSMEGRLETSTLEQLNLERSWSGWGVRCERFGAVGSLPVNGYFPFVALEDARAGVTWAATVAHPGSWQIEVYRRDDTVALSGGLADMEFGHWRKRLRRGESFTSPSARVTCVSGGLDESCDALTSAQTAALPDPTGTESRLPIVFNEWATTWGKPSHQNMLALASRLKGSGIRYLVIDAGWYAPPTRDWGRAHGDWQPSTSLYPAGLKSTADAIRAAGLVPGLWFEFETCGADSELWGRTDLLLKRDRLPLTVGNRRFLDFRKPAVTAYLRDRVLRLLRAGGFGYLKIDYNENIGRGVDGAESPGEGLRAHLAGVQDFLRQIRRGLPDLVIENCSSGGHRLEPSFLGLTHMSSFSDAHECPEIPIIAANLHRLMLPRQCQIWAVLRAGESAHRTSYSLTAAFLGRLCLSGDFLKLTKAQHALAQAAVDLYQRAAPVIANGRSRRFGPEIKAYRHPEGWQAVRRVSPNGRSMLVVAHTFARPGTKTLSVPLPGLGWRITEHFGSGRVRLARKATTLTWQPGGEFRGVVVRLSRR